MNYYISNLKLYTMKKLLFLIAALLLISNVWGQTGGNPSPVNYNIDIYPKTPEAAALSKFVDIPAGSYTGVADFSIPLYTIEFDGGSIPIELRYTTTGVKVGEIASRVGLGWVLNAGPSLSQQVIGVQDKIFPRPVVPRNPFIDIQNEDDYTIAATAAGILTNGTSPKDIKPDIFTYSLLHESGKYILDSNGGYGIPMPYNQIKIIPENYYTKMNITDEEGIQYTFQSYPGVVSKNTCANDDMLGLTYPDPNYKILKIKSIKNQEINYIYGQAANATYINSVTTQERISITGLFPPGPLYPPAPKCTNYTLSDDSALTEILFKGGKVLFTYSSERDDVNGEVKLTGVIVKNDQNEIIKNLTLSYGYFQTSEPNPSYVTNPPATSGYLTGSNKRLKLTDVTDNLTNGNYHLEYYESFNNRVLPPRFSNNQDYWGVFNGANNGDKSTPYTKYNNDGVIKIFESEKTGANKEPDIDYGRIGNLRKITYPTGGYTVIEYEADDYIAPVYMPDVYGYGNEPPHEAYDTDLLPIEFDIPANTYNREIQFWGQYHEDGNAHNGDCRWYLTKQNAGGGYDDVDNASGTATNDRSIDSPGHYKLWVVPTDPNGGMKQEDEEDGCHAQYRWVNEFVIDDSDTRKTGTIRVSKIESFDNNNGKITRTYSYKEPTENHVLPYIMSSGKNLGNEIFVAVSTQAYPMDAQSHYAVETLLSNNPGWQTATVRGKPIGYDYVQEFYISEKDPVKSYRKEYTFKNDMDDTWVQYDPHSPINYTWPVEGLDRGLLLEEKLFDSEGGLVKETFNQYEYDPHFNSTASSYIGGEFLGEGLEITPVRKYGNSSSDYEFMMSNFPLKNYWIKDTLTTTIEYKTPSLKLESKQRTRFSSNHVHTYPWEKETEGSNGETAKTVYQYPQDLIGIEPNMTALKNANRLSTPVITESYMTDQNGTMPVSSQKTEYAAYQSGTLLLPKFIYLKKGTQPFEKKITYDRYDDKGNLEQYTLEDGTVVSIIWGYNKQYPVAKIEGLPYTSIPSSLVTNIVTASNADVNESTEVTLRSKLEDLRKNSNLANAVVTTYTYDPLVGVTTVIAPNGQESFYRYDAAGRLDKILDKDSKVLKKMDYNYAH